MSFLTKTKNKLDSVIHNQDTGQYISMISSLVGESFKIVMACLLTLFIPQECRNKVTGETRVCELKDNFEDLTIYDVFVLVYNFITLGYFIYLYYVEIAREKWMIQHLDNNPAEDELHLKSLEKQYPKIFNRLNYHNQRYVNAYRYLKFFYFTNFIFSVIAICGFYYLDYRTVTSLLTNLILCIGKVTKGSSLANESLSKTQAISYFNIKNLSFNVIDPDYIQSGIDSSALRQCHDAETNNQNITNNIELTRLRADNVAMLKEIKENDKKVSFSEEVTIREVHIENIESMEKIELNNTLSENEDKKNE